MFSRSRLLSLTLFLTVSAFANVCFAKPEVVQDIVGFRKPNSARFSPDGKALYVCNFARGELGAYRGKSTISKLRVSDSGEMKLATHEFVSRLTAPVDLAFSPVPYGDVPAGSLWVLMGTPLIQNEDGKLTKDASKEFIGLWAIDPKNGLIKAKINLGPSSKVLLGGDKPLLAPASMAFDKKGNLYIGETGIGGHLFSKRVQGRPGLWRIDRRGMRDLVTRIAPSDVKFIAVTSMPGAIMYRETDDSLYFLTNHLQGIPSGSVFKIGTDDFVNRGLVSMQTIVRGLDSLSGIQMSESGRIILTSTRGEVLRPKGKKAASLIRFRPQVHLATPGIFSLLSNEDGSSFLAIPERSSEAGLGKGQTVKIVKLPVGY